MTKYFMMQIGSEHWLIIPAMIASTPFLEEPSVQSENWKSFWWLSACSIKNSLFPPIFIQCILGKKKLWKWEIENATQLWLGVSVLKCWWAVITTLHSFHTLSLLYFRISLSVPLTAYRLSAPLINLILTNDRSELLHYKPTVISTPWLFHHIWH